MVARRTGHDVFRDLLGRITAGNPILTDRFYGTHSVIALLQMRGADALLQQHQVRRTDFRKGQRLSPRDHVGAWAKPKHCPYWLPRELFDAFPETPAVRELKGHNKVLERLHCKTPAMNGTERWYACGPAT
ncbi:MAG: hypothetical protein FHK80_08055 [Azoarcus sp. PHD]|nr:MAG: hypothetical protein FHK80_08055 [Azoarcus sp. PHD]